jgi:hypothetical protein
MAKNASSVFRTVGPRGSARSIADAILADVKLFARGELGADDITVVVVRRRQAVAEVPDR